MISASIVLYKTNEIELVTVMRCLLASCVDNIYLIDNSPTDSLGYFVKMSFPRERVKYVYGQGNIGYGAGNNIAIRDAIIRGTDYHIVLNSDLEFKKGTIEALIAFMDNHKDVGLTMPNVTFPDGEIQPLCHLNPTPLDIFGRRVLPADWIRKRNDNYMLLPTGYNKVRNVPQMSGCFMCMRVSTLKRAGIFDERFFMYFEDFDLIRRIHEVSKTVFYPKVSIIHRHKAEHRTNKTLLKISIKSAIMYFNKWGWVFDKKRKIVNASAFDNSNIIE